MGLHANRVPRPKACDGTDAARGLLASIVFIGHFIQIFVGNVHALAPSGTFAVLFFFAISGFVISNSLVRHTAQDGAVDLASFAKRRFFRIMPPLIATFLVIGALEFALIFGGVHGDVVSDVPSFHGYHLDLFKVTVGLLTIGAVGDLGGGLDGPLWSLRYEIRCYLTAALVAWLLTSRATVEQKAMVVAALCTYWFVALFVHNEGPLSQLPWLTSFAAGFLAFRYQNTLAAIGWIGIASAVALSGAGYLALLFSENATIWSSAVTSICGCAFALLVFVLHGIAIKSRTLAALGGVSYTLYIAHFPILLALYLLIKTAPATLYMPLSAAAVVVAAVACVALGRMVERSSAQLAWTERQLSRIRNAIAMRVPQA